MPRTLILIAAGLLAVGRMAGAQDKAPAAAPAAKADTAKADSTKKLTADQLQSLVAPIALYPDDLLTNCLVAATYPLEVVALQQYLAKNPNLKDQALADSVKKQPWDPSIQSMAALPDAVKRLAEDIQWTTELGNAFLAQQKELMDAVQVMRKKAKDKGALESNEQQKVETKTVEKTQVIVVESANPEVVYVPSYSPTVVYGPPVYPYPPIYYPYYPPGAAFVSFSVGMMWGAAMWGGACCRYGWGGGGNVYINHNNNFNINNSRNNINTGNRNNINSGNRGGNNWQHNPSHRGGTPYGDRATNNKYGGDRAGNRASGAGQGGVGVSDRSASGNRGGANAGVSDRSASGNRAGAGGGDKIGNQNIPRDAGNRASTSDRGGSRDYGGGGSSFGGGSRGYDGGSARSSSSRGASSMGGRSGGGGFSRGGGGGGRRR